MNIENKGTKYPSLDTESQEEGKRGNFKDILLWNICNRRGNAQHNRDVTKM
jgi:hypothetical protein